VSNSSTRIYWRPCSKLHTFFCLLCTIQFIHKEINSFFLPPVLWLSSSRFSGWYWCSEGRLYNALTCGKGFQLQLHHKCLFFHWPECQLLTKPGITKSLGREPNAGQDTLLKGRELPTYWSLCFSAFTTFTSFRRI